MDFIDSVAVDLVAAVGIAGAAAAWARRRTFGICVQRAREAWRRRGRPRELSRGELIGRVRRRAALLRIDVAVKQCRRGQVVSTTFHPSGITRDVFTGDHASYFPAAHRRDVDPRRSGSHRRPPQIVSRWSDQQLRSWLAEHAHRTPSNR